MELKRRKKKEETSITENKIAEMKVRPERSLLPVPAPSLQREIARAEERDRKWEYYSQKILPFCVGLVILFAGYYMRSQTSLSSSSCFLNLLSCYLILFSCSLNLVLLLSELSSP